MKERSSKSSPSSASSLKTSPSDRVLIGRIVGSFGIKGEVKIQPLTDFEERFDLGQTVFVRSSPRKIESSRFHKGQWLLGLEGCTSRSAAEELQWEDVYASSEGRPELPQDTFLTKDLIGMEVFEEDGTSLGVVEDVLPYPAHDLFQVGAILIPVVKEFVRAVDPAARRITVRLIEGMKGE